MSPKPTSAYRPALNALGNLSQEHVVDEEAGADGYTVALWAAARTAQDAGLHDAARRIVDFFSLSAQASDPWLTSVGTRVLPTLYEAYQAVLSSFRVPGSSGGDESARTSLIIDKELQANVPALNLLSSILDLSVDCCDVCEEFSGEHLLNFVRATSAILLASSYAAEGVKCDANDSARDGRRCARARHACDVLRRNASLSLANIVETVPSCRDGAAHLFQARNAKLMCAIRDAPELSIQRSLLRFAKTMYSHMLRRGSDDKFLSDMDAFLTSLQDDVSPRNSDIGTSSFEAIDLASDDAGKLVERFRGLLSAVVWEEDSPAARCAVMQSCHLYLGTKAGKKSGELAAATVDWNLRGIAITSKRYMNNRPIHVSFSDMRGVRLAAGWRELEFAVAAASPFPYVAIHFSSDSARRLFKGKLLPRLESGLGFAVKMPAQPKSKSAALAAAEFPPALGGRKASTPASEPIGRFAVAGDAANACSASEDEAPAAVLDSDGYVESVFTGLKADGILLLPRLNLDADGCAVDDGEVRGNRGPAGGGGAPHSGAPKASEPDAAGDDEPVVVGPIVKELLRPPAPVRAKNEAADRRARMSRSGKKERQAPSAGSGLRGNDGRDSCGAAPAPPAKTKKPGNRRALARSESDPEYGPQGGSGPRRIRAATPERCIPAAKPASPFRPSRPTRLPSKPILDSGRDDDVDLGPSDGVHEAVRWGGPMCGNTQPSRSASPSASPKHSPDLWRSNSQVSGTDDGDGRGCEGDDGEHGGSDDNSSVGGDGRRDGGNEGDERESHHVEDSEDVEARMGPGRRVHGRKGGAVENGLRRGDRGEMEDSARDVEDELGARQPSPASGAKAAGPGDVDGGAGVGDTLEESFPTESMEIESDDDGGKDDEDEAAFIQKLVVIIRATLAKHKARTAKLSGETRFALARRRKQASVDESAAAGILQGRVSKVCAAARSRIFKAQSSLRSTVRLHSGRASSCKAAAEHMVRSTKLKKAQQAAMIKNSGAELQRIRKDLHGKLAAEMRAASASKERRASKASKSDALLAGLSTLLDNTV